MAIVVYLWSVSWASIIIIEEEWQICNSVWYRILLHTIDFQRDTLDSTIHEGALCRSHLNKDILIVIGIHFMRSCEFYQTRALSYVCGYNII